MIEHYPKWIFASLHKHFNDILSGVYIEGMQKDLQNPLNYELRTDGPWLRQESPTIWTVHVDVNILVKTPMDPTKIHRIHELVTTAVGAFSEAIRVYKYGNTADDEPGTSVGCLVRVPVDRREEITVRHAGVSGGGVNEMKATVQALYRMEIRE
jgi:hypothetical protein